MALVRCKDQFYVIYLIFGNKLTELLEVEIYYFWNLHQNIILYQLNFVDTLNLK